VHSRFKEIDQIRGVAIILMVVFHTAFDLNFLEIYSINVWGGAWFWMAKTIQWIFILTTGITLTIAHHRGKSRLKHIFKLGTCAMGITLITWLLFKEKMIVFGILHFYTVALILAHPFLKLKLWNVGLGMALLFLSAPLTQTFNNIPGLFFLGMPAEGSFQALDYFPLLPWFGVFLIGVGIGNLFPRIQPQTAQIEPPPFRRLMSPLEKMARHSLLIYLVHQPVIFGILKVMFA
jgi:uncharacterized membrane protein